MIIDKIDNTNLYVNLGKRIAKAFQYIHSTDFSRAELGRHEIEGEDVFAIVMEYETKELEEGSLEAHRKYIDVQYIVSGAELIAVASLGDQIPSKEYNEKDDYVLFKESSSLIRLEAGMFTIFFPDDLHMPGVKLNEKTKVKKVVVKVRT